MTGVSGQKELWRMVCLRDIGNGSGKTVPKCARVILKTANKPASGPPMTKRAKYTK